MGLGWAGLGRDSTLTLALSCLQRYAAVSHRVLGREHCVSSSGGFDCSPGSAGEGKLRLGIHARVRAYTHTHTQ